LLFDNVHNTLVGRLRSLLTQRHLALCLYENDWPSHKGDSHLSDKVSANCKDCFDQGGLQVSSHSVSSRDDNTDETCITEIFIFFHSG